MKKILLILGLGLVLNTINAQEEKKGLDISGSVDTYFKYDFAGESNIPTSFADNHNSISIGMLDIALSQTIGKASFVGEISFGPRSFKSIPTFDTNHDGFGDGQNVNIQNLFISYALSEKVSLTGGYMGTFVGYEVISPAGNFNYSTSYLFSAGPFQNAGFKIDWSISERFGLMAGVFDDWNVYEDVNGISDLGIQLFASPVDGWDAYLNFLTGSESGMIIDLTTGFQITDGFYLGLNAADYTYDESDLGGYTGFALYPQVAFSEKLSLGYRGEYFILKEDKINDMASENVFSNTFTLNYYAGPLTFSTELRMDSASEDWFVNSDEDPHGSASQFLVAAIYAF
ncbi:outer membrane beta-barrel protein [Carboxylicivirga sp. M1479]|uniref:outer membrane beta-barrel protein n=1 Tax=Carboxylicivirga sp. M1479 TaxID=2594476 RepID=UPI001178A892|nr:outer membrane beta-barrel protein [Carboxylicivirga sp. M1479]TRX72299.1 porin [Carboxylicivirga sp. M1479]